MHRTILAFAFSLFALSTTFSQQNYYTVKFPDDRTIVSCGGTADTSDMPVITYYSNCNFNVGISVKDQVFNLNSTGGCKKILRTWKLLYWCDYDPNWPAPTYIDNSANTDVGPTVWGNSYNHGYLQYTQIIKIVDNVPPVFTNCPTDRIIFCDYTNNDPNQYGSKCEGPIDLQVKVTDACSKSDLTISYRLYLDLDCNGTMETYRSSSDPNAWPIVKTIAGDTVCASIVLPNGVGLPYGVHKVEWIANDKCGNESICKYEFEVRDCKPPTIVCMNGLSINIMPTGMITLWASDFIIYYSDNCTPNDQIKIGIRKAGTGTGFPTGSTSVTFDCNEIGNQPVEVWVQDAYGNADYCTTFVIVQDHFGACVPSGPITGTISTDQNVVLTGAKVILKSNLSAIPNQSVTSSDALGKFAFASAPGTCNYSIVPSFDTLVKLGVNTMDIMLAEMHMTGAAALPNPYRIIAADVNHDNLVNADDLNAMGDLIVGTAQAFPGNTAWRFVPSAFVFPNPNQPFATAFPEKISTTCPAPSGLDQNFVAVKTGDVDGAAFSSNKSGDPGIFLTEKQRFLAGDWVEVAIQSPDLTDYAGFQFTIEADPEYLSLQSVEPGTLNPRLGVLLEQNKVAASWYSIEGIEGSHTVLVLKFKALKRGGLAGHLRMSSAVAKAEAYDHSLSNAEAILEFAGPSEDREEIVSNNEVGRAQLYPVSPNPTPGPVAALFHLPEAGFATLSLTDLNGRVLVSQNAYFEKGKHRVELPVETSGLLLLQLQTNSGIDIQRVVVER